MAFLRNPGRFKHKIELLKPGTVTRDELGGVSTGAYTSAGTMFAMCEQKSQTRQQILGDYVSVATRFFIVRDIRQLCTGLNRDWRIVHCGLTYQINDITLIDESSPYYLQITATALNADGGVV